MNTTPRSNAAKTAATRFAILVALLAGHCILIPFLAKSVNDANSYFSTLAILLSVLVAPGILIGWKLFRGTWYTPGIIASSLCLMTTVSGVAVPLMKAWNNPWHILFAAYDLAFFVWAIKTLLIIQAAADESRATRREINNKQLDTLRRVGGMCPVCNGTGREKVSGFDKAMIAYGGATASSYGTPVSGRQLLREFEVPCKACEGIGSFQATSTST